MTRLVWTLPDGSQTARWAEDEGGGGGDITPPVDLQGTDPDEAVLTLRADDAQTEHIFRVYDDAGDLVVDVDAQGRLDVNRFVVNSVPVDTGSGVPGASGSIVAPDKWEIGSGVDATGNPLRILRWTGAGFNPVFQVGQNGAVIRTNPLDATSHETGIEMGASQDGTGNAIELWDFDYNNLLFAVTYTGGVIFPSADPHVAGAWWDNAGTLTRSAG